MAAVSLSPLPQHPFPMSSRRVPLANNPNAANSPFRGNAAAAAKRPRPTNAEQGELTNDQSPAKKKQLLEISNNGTRRSHNIPANDREGKIFNTRPDNASSNAFSKRLAAAKDTRQVTQRAAAERDDKKQRADIESVKAWKRHYHKVFPTFVFYFESLPQDVCIRSSRQIATLGAREEKFFSRAVTHIVTARPIPPSPVEADANANQTLSKGAAPGQQHGQARTINPSLLEKAAEVPLQQKPKHVPEFSQLRKANAPWQDAEPRRAQPSNTDVLHKAREMNMKIWALEKFERMMGTMFNEELDDEDDGNTRKEIQTLAPTKPTRVADLNQLLREEKKVTTDRAWSDIVPFRGYYVYVHDMDERTKPAIVREYQKVASEEGDWPQLRSVPMPRCPFVEDFVVKREPKEKSKDKEREKKCEADKGNEKQQAPRTRSNSTAVEAAKVEQLCESRREPLRENDNGANRAQKPAMPAPPTSKTFEPPKLKPSLSTNLDSLPPHLTNPRFTFSGVSRNPGREPAASGVNPSNVTSAIRSQMISSTAAAPGARAGTSRELHQLQRKAVERRSGLSNNSMPSSYMNDVRAAINNEQPAAPKRNLRKKPAETMTRIHEDETQSDEEEDHLANPKMTRAPKKKIANRREPKPGYCENCKDKYEDFNEHVESRKHKKFAMAQENWTELDALLAQLTRPVNFAIAQGLD